MTSLEGDPQPTSRWRSSEPPAQWEGSSGPIDGDVELPFHLYWSDDTNRFDLSNRARMRSMYQIVLTEGSTADVVAFVNPDLLLNVWDELWLSRAVHEAWDSWVQPHR
jgi:hypothetical protein